MKSVVSSLWSLVGFGQRRRLETAELTLRAALAQRDVYLRQLNDALAACEELRRQRNYFRSELELRRQRPQPAPDPALDLSWQATSLGRAGCLGGPTDRPTFPPRSAA